MSAWDKLQLGWLDYQLVEPGDGKTKIKLGPSEAQSNAGKQAAVVLLPDKQVTTNSARRSPARSSTTRAPATTWTTPC